MLVNWHRLVSANRWPIDNHPKVFRNHWLPLIGLQKLFVISLFQALGQWGRLESRAGRGNEWGLVEKEGATRNQMTPSVLLPWQQFCCRCCVNKNRNSRFFLKQEPSTPPNLMMGLKTIWELFLFQVGDPLSHRRACKWKFFLFFDRKRLGPKSCYGNSTQGLILFLFWCTFMVPSFKNTASIFLEISFLQYFTTF